MLPIPDEIKEKLVKALDDENDVDDATVVEMVSVLEKYPITRATLEETKIGKMVNDLRRKIKNEKLAKRVKQLVRNWKKILDETPSVNGSVPGPTHPAISQLRSSPAVSPALSRVASTGRLVSPAPGRVSPAQARPGTPKQLGKKNASPALAVSRPVAAVSRSKVSSPGMGTNGVAPASSAAAQKVASPALPGARSKVASPALAARTSSPTVPARVLSPAVSSRVESKIPARVASPLLSGRVTSPAGVGLGKTKGSPLLAQSAGQSPRLQSALSIRQEHVEATDRGRLRKGASTSDLANVGDKPSISAFHSEHHLDRLSDEVDRGRQDSDEESSCKSSRAGGSDSAHPHNHSMKTTLSLNSNNKNFKDQRELSKTNMANRKRAREMSDSPPEESSKQPRLESSSLSANSHRHSKVINGYASKSSKKQVAAQEASRVHSVASMSSVHSRQVSSPHLPRTASEENLSLPHSHSDSFLIHQESTESNLSAQSFDRPSRDKHKVKTTEQLIEDLQKKNNGSKIGHSIMTKLRTNQIEQEQDVLGSVLPAGMKPRGKRGRPRKSEVMSVPPSNVTLSQVKSELVERFLNTSDPSSPMGEYSPFKDDLLPDPGQGTGEGGTCSSLYSKDNLDMASTSRQDLSEPAPKEENSRDATSPLLPSTSQAERTGSALTLEEIYAQLPPVDYDIDWDAVDFFELPEPAPVTEEAVDHLHSEQLPGINGLYDMNGDWTSWQQVVTLPSYEGNQLHILPYVDLDN
ncbi:uncharacterized protein LOC143280191 [Babylonia areolata]|uniref:uncharacterized protein LOC143280191 n=1 Tax=Babylonia areolata TaxID=304850 RepID=UPI003FD5C0CF